MNEQAKNQIQDIPKLQRRVLGVLMEKAFTTPEQYPLTLKATTSGCNQKSNRDPTVSYAEDLVMDGLDRLRESGLAAEVFPGGGRTARYRHYMRHCFEFSEAQFAVIAELLLRGRQQLGELRTRASRMVRIESMEQLREELIGLQQMGYLQANGPLERRGIEVDHTFYLSKEGMNIGEDGGTEDGGTGDGGTGGSAVSAATASSRPDGGDAPSTSAVSGSSAASGSSGGAAHPSEAAAAINETLSRHVEGLERLLQQLQATIQEQAGTIQGLEQSQADLQERLDKLERDLGV